MADISDHLAKNVETFSTRNEDDELGWQRFRIETICRILERLPNKALAADVGTFGGMATPFFARTGIGTLHGFDISEPSLDKLRAKGFEGYIWDCDGGRCPMPDDTYDLVIASELIEHLVNTDTFVAEVRRILKPGGHLLISTPNLASWFNRLRLLQGRVPRSQPGVSSTVRRDTMVDNHHIRVNVLSEWTHLLEVNGFTIVETAGSSHLQNLHGGLKIRALKWLDRLACRVPTMAVNIIIVGRLDGGKV